jgi:hypothetical protein
MVLLHGSEALTRLPLDESSRETFMNGLMKGITILR